MHERIDSRGIVQRRIGSLRRPVDTHRLDTSHAVVPFSGYSMYPALRPGDVLVTKNTCAALLATGDIACVPAGKTYRAHRIISVRGDDGRIRIVTKGDNQRHSDEETVISGQDTISVVVLVRRGRRRLIRPRCGFIASFLCRRNMTPGIIMGTMGAFLRRIDVLKSIDRENHRF